MDVCRICLSESPDRDIYQLRTSKKHGSRTHLEILPFCLDIQVAEDSITKKLCTKCFNKTLSFYKFKTMALRSDAFLRRPSISSITIKLEMHPVNEQGLSLDPVDGLKSEVKTEGDAETEYPPTVFGTVLYGSHTTEDRVKEEKYIKSCEQLSDSDSNEYHKEDPIEAQSFEENCETEPHNNPTDPVKISKKSGRLKRIRKQTDPLKTGTKTERQIKKRRKKTNVEGASGVCDQCGANVQNLKHHAVTHIPKHERKKFPCKECDKTFFTHASLFVHRNIKHLGKLGHCDICDKDYTDLKTHQMTIHDPERMPVQCAVCKLRFPSQAKLDMHTSRHTKEKPFQCDHCGKNFRIKLLLDQHVRSVHEKEKNFVCQHCSKGFFKKYHFANHLRTHTKERPYKCLTCDKAFITSTHLKNHQYSHSAVKAFHCTLCAMTFSRPGNLAKHMLSHTNEKRYPCRYCGIAFKRSGPRRKHESEKHEKNMMPSEMERMGSANVDCNYTPVADGNSN